MNDDDWDFFNKSVGKLEKEVITLKKENERLKENIHSMLFTDDVVQDRYDKAKEENTKLTELLKRARGLMNYTKDWACSDATEEMIAKINQVLGEKH